MQLADVCLLRIFIVSFLPVFVFFFFFLAIFLHCCRQIGRQTNEQVNVRADRVAIQLHFDLCSIFGHCTDNVVIVANAEKKKRNTYKFHGNHSEIKMRLTMKPIKHECNAVSIQYIQ